MGQIIETTVIHFKNINGRGGIKIVIVRDHVLLEGQKRPHMGSSICPELIYLGPDRSLDPEGR